MSGRSLMVACAFALGCSVAAVMSPQAVAADLTLLAGSSMRLVLPDLLPRFEKSSGNKVEVKFGTLGANAKSIAKGEGDVAVITEAQDEELEKTGKLLAGSRAYLAKVGYGVLIKAAAAKPDLSTVDSFKRTLIGARSIGMGNPAGGGPVGVYTANLVQRLGLTDALKAKARIYPSGTEVANAIAKGEVELGIGLASDAHIVPGLAVVPLPAEIQNYTQYTLGIAANSRSVGAAKALIKFLTSQDAKQALGSQGFETRAP